MAQSDYTRLPSELLDLKDIYKWIYEASDDVLINSASEGSAETVPYTLMKEITVPQIIMHSNFRVTFSMRFVPDGGAGTTAYAKIYKNGVAMSSTVHSTTSGSWQSKTEDVGTFDEGDLIQIYGKINDYWGFCKVKDLRIRGYIADQRVFNDLPTWS